MNVVQEIIKDFQKNPTPEKFLDLANNLLGRNFYIVQEMVNDNEKISYPCVIQGTSKEHHIPLFTSLEEALKWDDPNIVIGIINFDDVIEKIKSSTEQEGIVIDPFGNHFMLRKDVLTIYRTKDENRNKENRHK